MSRENNTFISQDNNNRIRIFELPSTNFLYFFAKKKKLSDNTRADMRKFNFSTRMKINLWLLLDGIFNEAMVCTKSYVYKNKNKRSSLQDKMWLQWGRISVVMSLLTDKQQSLIWSWKKIETQSYKQIDGWSEETTTPWWIWKLWRGWRASIRNIGTCQPHKHPLVIICSCRINSIALSASLAWHFFKRILEELSFLIGLWHSFSQEL